MKILMFNEFTLIPGGIDQVIKHEIDGLRYAGADVRLFSFHHKDFEEENIGSRIRILLQSFRGKFLLREFQEVLNDFAPDVIHFHNCYNLFRYPVWDLVDCGKSKIILHLHNFYPFCLNSLLCRGKNICTKCFNMDSWIPGIMNSCFGRSFIKSLYCSLGKSRPKEWIKKICKASIIVTPSNFVSDFIKYSGIPENKILTIPNATENIPHKFKNNSGHILYLGSIREEKGIDLIIEAAAQNKKINFVIAGDGPDAEKYIPQFKKHENIQYQGYVTGREKQDLLAGAEFMVFPGYCPETFGLAALEAFSAGVPVLSTGSGALQEIISEGKTGRIVPAESFSSSVGIFYNELKVKREDYSILCIKFAKQYSEALHIEKLMGAYRQCI